MPIAAAPKRRLKWMLLKVAGVVKEASYEAEEERNKDAFQGEI